jgi:prolipoprotein diacylglyceryltransferase
MFGSYLIYYSIGRLVTENLRIDPSDIILGLRTNVWSAILGIVAGAAIVYIQRTRYQAQRPVFTKNALDSTPE